MRRPISAAILFAGVLYAFGAASAEGYDSVNEILKDLRRSYAPGAEWRRFRIGSYSTYRKRGRAPIAGQYDEVYTQLLDGGDEKLLRFSVKIGANGGWERYLPLALDAPILDASKAHRLGDDVVTVAGKKFPAEVYQFEDIKEKRGAYTYRAIHKFWLNAEVPTGVLRHIEVREERVEAPVEIGGVPFREDQLVSRDETDTKLVDIDVSMTVDGKTLRCYCIETESRDRYGTSKSRICNSPSVPGGKVRGEARKYEQGRETGYTIEELIEFEVAR